MTEAERIAAAYAHMDEVNAARLRGEETADERRLRDAREGLPDLPPVEDLEPVGPPPVAPLQSAAPVPYREWQIRAQFPTPEAMCEAWGRVRGFEAEGGAVRPRGIVSQLRELREMARLHDPDFDRTVRPSPAQQCADEVERTPGFLKAQDALWFRYVRGFTPLGSRFERRLTVFHARLRRQWPNGFTGESDAPPPLRKDQIAAIQAEVDEAQRHPRRRMA